MRSMRPVNLRSPKPSTASSTAMPTVSSGTSTAGTSAASSSSRRSTTVTIGASNATFSPGCTWRLATMPDSGAVTDRVLDRVLREPHLRLGRLDAALRDAVARLAAVERVLRDELLRQQLVVHRPRLLGERQLRLRALERALALDELGLEVGGVDAREQLARLHRLALADGELADVARHLGLDRRLVDRLQRAGHRQPARERLALDVGEVGRVNSSVGGALPFRGVRSAFFAARSATAPPTAADDDENRQPGDDATARETLRHGIPHRGRRPSRARIRRFSKPGCGLWPAPIPSEAAPPDPPFGCGEPSRRIRGRKLTFAQRRRRKPRATGRRRPRRTARGGDASGGARERASDVELTPANARLDNVPLF